MQISFCNFELFLLGKQFVLWICVVDVSVKCLCFVLLQENMETLMSRVRRYEFQYQTKLRQ